MTTPERRRSKEPNTLRPRLGRTLAFQVLYEVDLTGHDWRSSLVAQAEIAEASRRVVRFAEGRIEGVLGALERIDALIAAHAPLWPVEQLSPVDRNLLRLAIYELLPGSSVPPLAAINEAVELAKEFGGEGSARFVHAVLGSVLEELSPAATTSPA